MNEPKRITVWQRWVPDDFGGHWEHNHIEDDWVEGDRPVGNAEQTKQWAGHKWEKKFFFLVDGVVRVTSEYAWEQKMKKGMPHRKELLEYPEEITIRCPKCGEQMSPVWFVEEEGTVLENRHYYRTGRVRDAVDYLTCPYCFHNECVDGDFMAGPWR